MKPLILVSLLWASAAEAQLLIPGAAVYPSPGSTQVVLPAQCVIATPVAGSPSSVILTPCPNWTAPPPQPAHLPAPTPPPVVTAPIAPTPEPKEPTVLRIEVVPVAPESKPVPKAAPKAAPKTKECPC